MYNNGYGKGSNEWTAKKIHKSGKSCSYYMQIIFFFSSLIQSLIIVSLVLFLVYGKRESTVEEKRVQELELGFSKMTLENLHLKAKQKNLTQQLNVTLTSKINADKELIILRKLTNSSSTNINILQSRWNYCEQEKRLRIMNSGCPPPYCPDGRSSGIALKQAEEMLKFVKTNFTETVALMKINQENINKEKLRYQLEAIELRRDKIFLEERIQIYERTCKEDFVRSLQGIPEVTQKFLQKVDDLFAKHEPFQLTCEKQAIRLREVRANCSSLSREVEDKLQKYLNSVGSQVTMTVNANAMYTTENKRLKQDILWCKSNKSAMIEENQKALKDKQLKHDDEVEKLLLQVQKLRGNERIQTDLLAFKESEIKMFVETIKGLNNSLNICKSPQKGSFGTYTGGSSTLYQWPNIGSTGTRNTGFSNSGPSTGIGGVGSSGSVAGRSTSGVGSSGTGYGSIGTSGTGYGGVGSTGKVFGSAGSSGTGVGHVGSTGTAFGGVGSNVATQTRTGMAAPSFPAAGSTAIGSSPYGGTDLQLTAQINQHLRELQRYGKEYKQG